MCCAVRCKTAAILYYHMLCLPFLALLGDMAHNKAGNHGKGPKSICHASRADTLHDAHAIPGVSLDY